MCFRPFIPVKWCKSNRKEIRKLLELGTILKNEPAAKDIYEMVLQVPGIAKKSKPGQFVNLRLSHKLDPLLRRPISLHGIDPEKGTISMLYLVVGEGTSMMKDMEARRNHRCFRTSWQRLEL